MDNLNTTIDYLTTLRALAEKAKRKSVAAWLLQHGRPFEVRHEWPIGLPLKRGEPRGCFRNATLAAMWSNRLVYCEGVADACIPVDHAWVYDLETKVAYDPTWKDGHSYFGVAFREQWLSKFILEKQFFGVLSGWRFTEPKGAWKHGLKK